LKLKQSSYAVIPIELLVDVDWLMLEPRRRRHLRMRVWSLPMSVWNVRLECGQSNTSGVWIGIGVVNKMYILVYIPCVVTRNDQRTTPTATVANRTD